MLLSPRFLSARQYLCQRLSCFVPVSIVGSGLGAWALSAVSSAASLKPVATGCTIAAGAVGGALLSVGVIAGVAYFCCTRPANIPAVAAQASPPSPDHHSVPEPSLPLSASVAISPPGETRSVAGVVLQGRVDSEGQLVGRREVRQSMRDAGWSDVPLTPTPTPHATNPNAVPTPTNQVSPHPDTPHPHCGGVAQATLSAPPVRGLATLHTQKGSTDSRQSFGVSLANGAAAPAAIIMTPVGGLTMLDIARNSAQAIGTPVPASTPGEPHHHVRASVG